MYCIGLTFGVLDVWLYDYGWVMMVSSHHLRLFSGEELTIAPRCCHFIPSFLPPLLSSLHLLVGHEV
jgi:hypothetical protein